MESSFAPDDTPLEQDHLVNKILKLKLWDDENGGRWKKSVMDMNYQVLLVSQFTLLATTKKGNKPDFRGACSPQVAKEMYESFVEKTREIYSKEKGLNKENVLEKRVQDGVFGAMMEVPLVNDGPVTFEISTPLKDVGIVVSPKEMNGSKDKFREQKGRPMQNSDRNSDYSTPKLEDI